MPILVAGHSHTMALIANYAGLETPVLKPAPEREEINGLYGPWPRPAEYWDALVASAAGQAVALSWGGTEWAAFLFEDRAPFDFLYNKDPSLGVDETAHLVPESLIKASYQRFSLDELPVMLRRLHDAGASAIALLGPPPPKHEVRLTVEIREVPYFQEMVARLGISFDQVRVISKQLRLKLWRLLEDSLAGIAAANQVLFLPSPECCRNSDGFLLEEYSDHDSIHGNYAYGAVVIAELKERLAALDGKSGDAARSL